jgi:hypothetical protein
MNKTNFTMKKLIVALCTVVMLGSTGTVLAKGHKVSICHNGSTYNTETRVEDPISFVITIAGREIEKAVEKHVANHADLETYLELGEGEECNLLGDGSIDCNVVTLCGPVITDRDTLW